MFKVGEIDVEISEDADKADDDRKPPTVTIPGTVPVAQWLLLLAIKLTLLLAFWVIVDWTCLIKSLSLL